jgi:hypothetical protein
VNFSGVINDLLSHRTFNDVLKSSAEQTGRGYKDSFLYEMEKGIWDRPNIRFQDDQNIEQG